MPEAPKKWAPRSGFGGGGMAGWRGRTVWTTVTVYGAATLLGYVYLSLARICCELSRYGVGLESGQHVITGTLLVPPVVSEPSGWRARFGALGDVSVSFS